MCGITGFIDFNKSTDKETLNRMVSTLSHRGPDDRGAEVYSDELAQIGLGQTRLSILDLSPAGHQPMEYENFAIVFNGEIYNFREIKQELAELGHQFKSESDTEMILHAFKQWGPKCVHRFIGMFAFLIYDKFEKKAYAFRDRAGVKPFYYYYNEGRFLFGSELKALHQHPAFGKKIDAKALRAYFNYGYVPSPYCIFQNARKLEPGHYLEYDLLSNHYKMNRYWDAKEFYMQPKFEIGYEEAKEKLHSLLKSAYNYRMVADVPVGVFLSGGYDSTSVAAILQAESTQKLKTFTIGFDEGNNEAPDARKTAAYLGTDHNEYTCTTKEAQKIIPELSYYYDEPFADSSAIPTMLVSRFARDQVTVALSADAGDELFAGYMSYPDLRQKLAVLNKIPDNLTRPVKAALSVASNLIPESKPAFKHKLSGVSRSLNKNRLKQASDLFRIANSLPEFYMKKIFLIEEDDYQTNFDLDPDRFNNPIEMAMAVDYQSYLQNDILTKVDRATMSVSLEGREPMVDHRLLEFAARLPLSFKMNGTESKIILKDIVHEYIPREMMERPKSGFSLPINSWLRSELSWLLDEFLSREALQQTGLFNASVVLEQVALFKKNKFHYSPLIWKLLMFQMWYKRWIE